MILFSRYNQKNNVNNNVTGLINDYRIIFWWDYEYKGEKAKTLSKEYILLKKWTTASVKSIINEIKDNFEFDGYFPKIKVDGSLKKLIGKSDSLCLECRMN